MPLQLTSLRQNQHIQIMADIETELNERFAPPGATLSADVLTELLQLIRLFSIDAQDLFFKWESYVQKMGVENTHLTAKTARDFRKDMQDALERESKFKGHVIHASTKKPTATPRASTGNDVFGMLDGMVSVTPAPSKSATLAKRKANNFDTPAPKSSKSGTNSSPAEQRAQIPSAGGHAVSFAERANAGKIEECLNDHLPAASSRAECPSDSRVKLKAYSDSTKFTYKPMAMKLSEASEILDDRIDVFTELVQAHYDLEDSVFGNPAAQSTAEIVAVGRIACDQPNGKLNAASLVLETSRRMGAGIRVPLRLDGISYDLFPGRIVALRGTNVSGEYFAVSEVLTMPLRATGTTRVEDMDTYNARLTAGESGPLSVLIGSGPYTTESDLSFAPLQALLDKAQDQKTDLLILTGPFLDLEHPMIASGDLEPHLPPDTKIRPERLSDVFRVLIGAKLNALAQALPSVTIALIPSIRDAISKHVSWPQDRFARPGLGLPKQAVLVTNPITLGVNEFIVGVSSQDILSELRRENVHQAGKGLNMREDLLARLSGALIEQQHYFPIFPPQARENLPEPPAIPNEVPEPGEEKRLAAGANLDLGYLKIAEFPTSQPDLLILPSVLNPFVKVVNGVVVINPGTLSKRRAAGTYVALNIQPRSISEAERAEGEVTNNLFERVRVDVTKV